MCPKCKLTNINLLLIKYLGLSQQYHCDIGLYVMFYRDVKEVASNEICQPMTIKFPSHPTRTYKHNQTGYTQRNNNAKAQKYHKTAAMAELSQCLFIAVILCPVSIQLELSGQSSNHNNMCLFTEWGQGMRSHTGDTINHAKQGALENTTTSHFTAPARC